MTEDPWHSERRARWKPDRVRLLLIAESAPDDGGDTASRRYFYEDALTSSGGLFRGVVRALFDDPPLKPGPNGVRIRAGHLNSRHELNGLHDSGPRLFPQRGDQVDYLIGGLDAI